MANSTKLGAPLAWSIRITDANGNPTPEFQRHWEDLRGTAAGIPQLSTPAQVSAVLDVLGTTRGALLFRGAGGWQLLTPGTAGQFLETGGPGADPLWGSVSAPNIQTLLDSIGATQGNVLYRSNTGWAVLAPGTAGQVLTTGGAGANPSWAAAGGGGGGYAAGTPPTVVQVAHNTAGVSVTFGVAPTNGNLLVSFTTNPSNDTAQAGWTRVVDQINGTDFGNICTKTAGAGESTTQQALAATATGGVVMYELHKGSGTPAFVTGASQAEQSGTTTVPVLYPNVKDCIGIGVIGLVSGVTYSKLLNAGVQDVLDNTGNRCMAAGHSDLSVIPMCGLIAVLSGSGSTKSLTALFT